VAKWSSTTEVFAVAIATAAGVGRVPLAPGTAGTLVGIPVYLLLQAHGKGLFLLSLAAFIGIAVWASDLAEAALGRRDPPVVVIDEIAGILVTLAWIRPGVLSIVLGFVLFRVFDIIKVPPANWIDRRLGGGVGIVADDVIAGLYAHACLRIILSAMR
jgi:phosphatidylglycerophosphatase A